MNQSFFTNIMAYTNTHIVFFVYTLLITHGSVIIPRTSTLTIRLQLEFIEKIHHYSEILRLKPSVLASLILQDKLEDWVKEYAKKIAKEVLD